MTDKQKNKLKLVLQNFGILSEFSQSLFIENCSFNEYEKGKILFDEKKKNATEYLLLEGVLHRFNINDNGKDITTGFYLKNTVVTPHFARTVKNKSIFSLQALTDIRN